MVEACRRFALLACEVDQIANDLARHPHLPRSKTTGAVRRFRNCAREMLRSLPPDVVGDLGLTVEIEVVRAGKADR